METDLLSKRTCCFTGHRPQKMSYTKEQVVPQLEKAIDEAIADGIETFITGMAAGTDVWAADIILKRKREKKNVNLICAVPHPGFENFRAKSERAHYKEILKDSDFVHLVNSYYYAGCYQVRNCWMVNNSERVIAVFDGSKGGTKNTLMYAKRRGVDIVNAAQWISSL